MANTISLAKRYVPLLQEVYRRSSVTSMIDTNPALVRESAAVGEILVPKMTVPGLADYSRQNGYASGDVTLDWVSKKLEYDRGRKFVVDAMDNQESLDQAFGPLLSTFMKESVVPEVDAVRFARFATNAKSDNKKSLAITASNVLTSLDDAIAALNDEEVTLENRYLFISEGFYKLLKQKIETSRLTQGQVVDRRVEMIDGMPLIHVPAPRFHTGISTTDNGYKAAIGSYPINFMIVQSASVMQVIKHEKMRQFAPDVNMDVDGWTLTYRLYHDAWVMPNKENGIYVCHGTTAVPAPAETPSG